MLSKKRRSSSAPAEIAAAPNALKQFAVFRNEARPGAGQSYRNMTNADAWVQDFTHLRFRGEEHYLAVVLDLKTRQVVGWRLGTRHTSELTLAAVLDALSKHPSPAILHSDQGSEYLSYKHQELCQRMEITLSCSKRASPWQNGFMERWFGNFKLELGNLNRHGDLARFHEAVAMAIFYYNHERIHLSLKMSPAAYAARLKEQNQRSKSLERVLQKTGAWHITIIMNSIYNYVEYYVSISLADSLSVLFWFLIIIFIVLYPILIKKKGKVSNRKRIAELKSKLCDLIEGKDENKK